MRQPGNAVAGFIKAVAFGALAGASPILLFSGAMAVFVLADEAGGPNHVTNALWVAFLPLIVTTPIVFVASIVLGVPLTIIFSRKGWESAGSYLAAGLVSGAVVVTVVVLFIGAIEAIWMIPLGAFSGGVTARTWWSFARDPQRGR